MKCSLCNLQYARNGKLKEHYIIFHKADPQNYFSKNFFKIVKIKLFVKSVFDVMNFLQLKSLKNSQLFKALCRGKNKTF